MAHQLGALEHVFQREQQLAHFHRRRQADDVLVRHERLRDGEIAILPRHRLDVFGGLLEAFVFLQAAHELGARIVFDAFFGRRPRQQQARFDLGQDRGHHQVFGGQLELHVVHQLDVVDVLARDFGDRDVEDVEVLAADQVQQQIERTFERFEDDFQRIRRDVQIQRHLQHGLAAHERERHFLLLRDGREDGGVGAVGKTSAFSAAWVFMHCVSCGMAAHAAKYISSLVEKSALITRPD